MTELSKRAKNTLERIKAGHFYEVYGAAARKSLDELVAAGLITGGCRAVTLGAYYVPATGYVPMQCERFEQDAEGYAAALVREAAPDLLEALKALLAACEDDCGAVGDLTEFDGDEEPVGGGMNEDGTPEPMALTFGHLRRAARAIAKAEGRTS